MKATSQKTTSKLQSRTERVGTNNGRQSIDFERRSINRSLGRWEVLELLRCETPRLFELAEVVGKWVWIQFHEKQPSSITRVLAELGFHWNSARQSWQHPCGNLRSSFAAFDPRKKFGSYFPADLQNA
jgi:hypothetical protein